MVILPRGEPVEARVWAMVIVVVAPSRDQIPGVAQVGEQMLVEALVAQTAVEAFHEAVLHGFARRDVVPLDLPFLLPSQDGVRCQLRSGAADHHAGIATHITTHIATLSGHIATLSGDVVELMGNALPRQRCPRQLPGILC